MAKLSLKCIMPMRDNISEVRYRTRPVAAFHNGQKLASSNSTVTNSSETDGAEPSGAPFIAVHDLTSQTFEKLQENWRNLEVFLRNLQARSRSQDGSSSGPGGTSPTGATSDRTATVRRPSYNNFYTFKYHPVVLEGEGSNSVGDINARGTPPSTFNGINFNPFPFDPKGEGNKHVDMERHTVATIYTIGICLTIMAIGSVMFILINKCDGTGGSSYIRTSTVSGNRNARNVRPNSSSNNARSRNGRSGGGGSSSNHQGHHHASNSVNASGVAESAAKISIDLPPSYASLFPEGIPHGPKEQENLEQSSAPVADSDPSVVNLSNDSQNENLRPSVGTTSVEN